MTTRTRSLPRPSYSPPAPRRRAPAGPSARGDAEVTTGAGAATAYLGRAFQQGALLGTGNPLDLAIQGSGFFQVTIPGGETGYTRAGMFHVNGQGEVVTNEGYQLEPALTIPANATSITISKDGIVSVTVPGQGTPQQVGTLELAQFQNPAGLEARGGNIFVVTNASGDPTTGVPGTDGLGTLVQGFVEDSNVSVVEEMVNMILGQRAYEANSKVIRAADEMLQQVNGLAR